MLNDLVTQFLDRILDSWDTIRIGSEELDCARLPVDLDATHVSEGLDLTLEYCFAAFATYPVDMEGMVLHILNSNSCPLSICING